MCSLEHFKIDLMALTEEQTALAYELDDAFFQQLESTEVQGGALHVSGSIRKAVGFFELQLAISGTVRITCDRCLDPMDQPIDTTLRQVVRLGSTEGAAGAQDGAYLQQDDAIIVDEADGMLDTAWLIYESVALAVPIQHVHQPGDCNDAMMRVLNEHSAARSSDADAKEETIDPRWEALKHLVINNS
jgi:uncharacterized metal-binding protein YceD (DUF177 family)